MANGNYPFFSFTDGKYYFWLGSDTVGPFDQYVEAHEEMSRMIEEAKKRESEE